MNAHLITTQAEFDRARYVEKETHFQLRENKQVTVSIPKFQVRSNGELKKIEGQGTSLEAASKMLDKHINAAFNTKNLYFERGNTILREGLRARHKI